MIYKILHRKLKIEKDEPHKNRGELGCSRRVSSFCSSSDTPLKAIRFVFFRNQGFYYDNYICYVYIIGESLLPNNKGEGMLSDTETEHLLQLCMYPNVFS
jgi:hypothetical protein